MLGCRELVRSTRAALVALAMLASATAVSAQTVVDPRLVEFDPSADHFATASDGTPLVQSYSLSIYQAGAAQVLQTLSLGKPAPDADGKIRVEFVALLNPAPVPGMVYEARVAAVGPGGTTASDVSNTFSFSVACLPSITPTSQTFSSSAGSGNVAVRTGTGCAWTAASNAAWLTITSGASGTESGTVMFNVAENTATTDRSGTLTIAGLAFSVLQTAAAPCAYTIAPTSQSMTASGGTGSLSVSTTGACPWTAASSVNWITITSAATGSGNGTVTFSVATNTTTNPRTGTITVGGQTFTLTQSGAPCTYALAPASQSVAAGGGSGSFAVTTSAGCGWTATSSAGWITITSGASGSDSGTVTFSVAANSITTDRTGTITVAGQTFTVTQAGQPCTYLIAPVSLSMPSGGGSGSFAVTTSAGCAWSASSNANWIIITAGASGSGSGTVTFSVSANSAPSQRIGTITVGGQTFTVDQAAAPPCTYAVSPSSQSMPAAGGTGSVAITAMAGCGWSSFSNVSWITLTGATSGTGNGTVNFTVATNTLTTSRTGTIMIAGQVVSVTQAAATTSCSYVIAPTSQSVLAAGTTGSFSVTTDTGCAWNVTSSVAWITVTSAANGSGNGTVSFTVAANTTTTPRSGIITVGGQSFTVSQSGASSCTYSVSPTSQSFGSIGGTNWVTVTATTGCNWTAVSNASWITIVGGASGTGSGTVTYSVAANTGAARTGTITVAGQTVTISQAAAACTYTVTPTSVNAGATATTGTISVTTGAGCSWGSFSSTSWITVSGGGAGSGSATYTVAANTTGVSRTGTILVAGKTIGFTQAGQ